MISLPNQSLGMNFKTFFFGYRRAWQNPSLRSKEPRFPSHFNTSLSLANDFLKLTEDEPPTFRQNQPASLRFSFPKPGQMNGLFKGTFPLKALLLSAYSKSSRFPITKLISSTGKIVIFFKSLKRSSATGHLKSTISSTYCNRFRETPIRLQKTRIFLKGFNTSRLALQKPPAVISISAQEIFYFHQSSKWSYPCHFIRMPCIASTHRKFSPSPIKPQGQPAMKLPEC
jgi:hypothetical protein